MIGRTNISLGGGNGGVTIVDLPTHLASLTEISSNNKVTLYLIYSDTDFVSGVDVVYKTEDYPTSPTDGDVVSVDGAATSIVINGLTNDMKYFFRVYLYRKIGAVKYFQTDDTNALADGTPALVSINGMTPTSTGENFILLANSGTFTLDIPDGLDVTAYMVGGGCNGERGSGASGGNGGDGGYYLEAKLNSGDNQSCTATVGAIGAHTKFTIDGKSYDTKNGTYTAGGKHRYISNNPDGSDGHYIPGVQTVVGSSGGAGESSDYGIGYGGSGAGDGGRSWMTNGDYEDGDDGTDAFNYGCGGGGGGEATDNDYNGGDGGRGVQGCIIIGWK